MAIFKLTIHNYLFLNLKQSRKSRNWIKFCVKMILLFHVLTLVIAWYIPTKLFHFPITIIVMNRVAKHSFPSLIQHSASQTGASASRTSILTLWTRVSQPFQVAPPFQLMKISTPTGSGSASTMVILERFPRNISSICEVIINCM